MNSASIQRTQSRVRTMMFLIAGAVLAFWGLLGFVAYHFLTKFW